MSVAASEQAPLQQVVRETMIAAGGYWRPLAALARLLEELGELSEALAKADRDELAGELADLWIITTALADQFLAAVPDPGAPARSDRDSSLAAVLAAAGPLARVVNHYDGPKVPRHGAPMPSLADAVAAFHEELAALAPAHEVDLAAAVRDKIERIHARGDIERFGPAGFDPSTAPVLAWAHEGLPERRWGAPQPGPDAETAAGRAELARGALRIFAKAARAERLEAFVIAGPPLIAGAGRAAWLGALVAELDPLGAPQGFELAGTALRASTLELQGRTLALVCPA